MTEDIVAFLALAEQHQSSIEILRQCLLPLKSAGEYMTELQWQTYARLRKIIENHDRALRESAIRRSRSVFPLENDPRG